MTNPQRGQCAQQAVRRCDCGCLSCLSRAIRLAGPSPPDLRCPEVCHEIQRHTCITYSLCRHASYFSNLAFVNRIHTKSLTSSMPNTAAPHGSIRRLTLRCPRPHDRDPHLVAACLACRPVRLLNSQLATTCYTCTVQPRLRLGTF